MSASLFAAALALVTGASSPAAPAAPARAITRAITADTTLPDDTSRAAARRRALVRRDSLR